MAVNLLELLERLFGLFSKCALNSLNNQTDFDSAIRRFDPSRPSQPLCASGQPVPKRQKRPQTAGFRGLAFGLYLPIWRFWSVKSPKVSAQLRQYSRFRETAARDFVRSRLPPDGRSRFIPQVGASVSQLAEYTPTGQYGQAGEGRSSPEAQCPRGWAEIRRALIPTRGEGGGARAHDAAHPPRTPLPLAHPLGLAARCFCNERHNAGNDNPCSLAMKAGT
jgi:hypothetical protein